MLEEAVYVPAPTNKIYGVRGPYIKSFDPVTGQLLLSSRFTRISFGMSHIAYDATTGNLYAAATNQLNYTGGDTTFYPNDAGIWLIDKTTLAATKKVDFQDTFANPLTDDCAGSWMMIAVAGKIITQAGPRSGTQSFSGAVQIDEGTYAIDGALDSNVAGGRIWSDIVFDGSIYWVVTPANNGIYGLDFPLQPYNFHYQIFNAFPPGGFGPWPNTPYSCCTVGGFLYVSCKTQNVIKTLFDDSARTIINTGISAATPLRIRYCNPALFPANPFAGTILVPGYNSDSIIQLVADVPTNKPGFELPFDVVFTPTRAFAVQHSSTGLKEIL